MAGAPLLDAVAFTAGREWDDRSVTVARNMLAQIPLARTYVTGGCRGGDAFLGHWCAITQRGAEHFVILPANRSQVDPWWETGAHAFRVRMLPVHEWKPWPALSAAAIRSPEIFKPKITVLEMPGGTSYADRNAELVRWGTVVYGFPAWPEDDARSLRSGTWQTIRMAREAGTLISWCCVQAPYHGRIEGNINHFLAGATGLCTAARSAPGPPTSRPSASPRPGRPGTSTATTRAPGWRSSAVTGRRWTRTRAPRTATRSWPR